MAACVAAPIDISKHLVLPAWPEQSRNVPQILPKISICGREQALPSEIKGLSRPDSSLVLGVRVLGLGFRG